MPKLLSHLLLDPQWRAWRLRAALLLYLAIVIVGSVPGARAQIGTVASGLVLHSLAYASLATLWFTGSTGSAGMRAIKTIATIMAMGAGDEFVQSFFTYRHSDIHDWMVDVSAASVACALLTMLLPRHIARR